MDADITAKILEKLRDEMREMRAEMGDLRSELRAGLAGVKAELHELRDDVGTITLRLGTVERVVVAFSRELATLVGRVTKLETT